jgi:hypothetical protein
MQVRIARRCHCVIKNNIEENHHCEDRNAARDYAQKLLERLQNNHCKAHIFFIRESEREIVIDSKFNVDDISI